MWSRIKMQLWASQQGVGLSSICQLSQREDASGNDMPGRKKRNKNQSLVLRLVSCHKRVIYTYTQRIRATNDNYNNDD